MSGKEKAEDFDDDFELDALDEASWGDDEAASGEATFSEDAENAPSSDGGRAREKKSGGGLLTGLVAIVLLGGGSFYAYQSGLIPGVGPGSSGAGESIMPSLTDAEDVASPDVAQDMPPMPDLSTANETGDAIQDVPLEDSFQDSETALAVTSDDALTPMPESAGNDALELAPLDPAQDEIAIAQIAEKDGMPAPDATQAADGKLQDGVMALPGLQEASEEAAFPAGQDESADSSFELDESTLLGETEKTPDSAASPTAPPVEAAAEDIDPLSDISDELSVTETTEIAPAEPAGSAGLETAAPIKPAEETAKAHSASEQPVADDSKADAAASKPAPEVASQPESQATSAPKPVESAKVAEAPKAAKPAVVPSWSLKSAKPGVAVLYDKRTGDVKTVGVGDRVSGLGTIKSVSKIDGKWVVQGTAGKVRQ